MFQNRIKTHHSAMAEGGKFIMGPRQLVEVLSKSAAEPSNNGTIYIHVPFCSKICSFCNMRRSLQKPHEQYANWIVEEIEQYGTQSFVKETVFDAVYFGGGTPTTLSVEGLRAILKALKRNFKFTPDAEFTIETTVTQLTDDKIHMFGEEGVNRFSVGIQTFHDAGRQQMNRVGSGVTAYEKLYQLKKLGFAQISMDLIYNYPEQTMDDLTDDLNKIINLDLSGFSMYSLINMKETMIEDAQGKDNDERMFFHISNKMEAAGYHFLELTKMVKDDRYKYIMNRHQGADTLPLGAGAGGSINGLAMMNPIKLDEYKTSVENFQNRQGMLTAPSYKEIVKFKGDIQTGFLPKNTSLYQDQEKYQRLLEQLIEEEYVMSDAAGYRLTSKGVFWGNTISRELSAMI